MRQIVYVNMMLFGIVGFSSLAHADLVLGDVWESEAISGYSGMKRILNFRDYKFKSLTNDQSHRISSQDTTSGSNGGGGGSTGDGSTSGGEFVTTTESGRLGLREVIWNEDNDKACRLEVNPVQISSNTYVRDLHDDNRYLVHICKGNEGNEKKVELAKGEVATGVSVCTTDKKDTADNRLKGIRLYAGVIDNNGNVSTTGSYQGNRHAHCKVWRSPVKCPGDHIVSSLKLYSKDHGFTGIGIKCRKVETAATP